MVVEGQGHSPSLQDQEVLLKVRILILMKYSKCSFLEAVEDRCLPTNLQTIHTKVVILSPKCLEVKEQEEQVELAGSPMCFHSCKVVPQEVQQARQEGTLILNNHPLVAALVQHHLQGFNSKSFPQVTNNSKRNDKTDLISQICSLSR